MAGKVAAVLAAMAVSAGSASAQYLNSSCGMTSDSLFNHQVTLIDGSPLNLNSWTGNVTLVTNVASF